MKSRNYFYVFCVIAIGVALLLVCANPTAQKENLKQARVSLELPEPALGVINQSLKFNVTLKYPQYMDSVRIEFGEKNNSQTIYQPKERDTILVFYQTYREVGIKTVRVNGYVRRTAKPTTADTQSINIGMVPAIKDKIIYSNPPPPFIIGKRLALYVTIDIDPLVKKDSIRYRWFKDNTQYTNVTKDTFNIDKLGSINGGDYYCITENKWGKDTSFVLSLQPIEDKAPPKITTQPDNKTITVGNNATFSIQAEGANLTYQWQKDKTNITNATQTFYEVLSATKADSGHYYRCIVANSAGKDTSIEAQLIVDDLEIPPQITKQPESTVKYINQTATFEVVATGTNLTYQWMRNSAIIPGATATRHTTPPLTLANNGELYRCEVSNKAGKVVSNPAVITVQSMDKPVIITQPRDTTVFEGETVVFSCSATGAMMSYQWQKKRYNITGQNKLTLEISATLNDNGATYRCIVSNAAGSDTSKEAILTVKQKVQKPVITRNPSDLSVVENSKATFSISATGTNLTYQWQKNRVSLPQTNDTLYTILSASLSDNQTWYRCIVSNSMGVDTSDEALLSVSKNNIPPKITTEPINMTVSEGTPAIFSLEASGTDLVYQWYRSPATVISGATSATYTLSPTTLADNGSKFFCIVSNSVGKDTSVEVSLTVLQNNAPPKIIKEPDSVTTVSVGKNATFSVNATGTGLSYQWYGNKQAIPSANSSIYTTPPTVIADNGKRFYCIVSNTLGKDTSREALLIVLQDVPMPVITLQPQSQTIRKGDKVSFKIRATGPSLTYTWRRNDSAIPGATDTVYEIKSVATTDNGARFHCIVANSAGAVTSSIAVLTVLESGEPAKISRNPEDIRVTEGSPAEFSVSAVGSNVKFQWYQQESMIPSATDSVYRIPKTTLAMNGTYFRCIVNNSFGGDTSSFAMLAVIAGNNTDAISYWNFDEGSGATIFDKSGQDNNGFISGATYTDGYNGKALYFNGVNAHCIITHTAKAGYAFGKGDFTISAWIKTTANTSGNDNARDDILSKGTPYASGFSLCVYNNKFGACIGNSGKTGVTYNGGIVVNDGAWHQVTVIRSRGIVRILTDNSQQHTYNNTDSIAVTTNLCIGKHGVLNEGFFLGAIDEVKIYNRALSAAEIELQYQELRYRRSDR
ncbi:MAG: immunoglobulin domain-containing protein [Chitinivibrionales bacterium]|nr:immunoglobulin domain-containing protein [Chitinivibrionales bacterium]